MEISIVIPAYNEEKFLPRTLTSLQKQTFKLPYEIIVVDNGSTDNTAKIAKKYGAQVIFEPRRGTSYACNTGFLHAKGKIIARTDADTLIPSDWLQKMWNAFAKDKKCIAVGGPTYPVETHWWENVFYFPTTFLGMYIFKLFRKGFLYFNVAVRREAFAKVNGFDTRLRFGEDTDFCLRLKKVGKVKLLPNLYVFTSARRIRSLGITNYVLGYTLANQLALWKGKTPTIGTIPVRPAVAKVPTHTKQTWLYVTSIPLLLAITTLSYSYIKLSPYIYGEVENDYIQKIAEKELQKLLVIKSDLDNLSQKLNVTEKITPYINQYYNSIQ